MRALLAALALLGAGALGATWVAADAPAKPCPVDGRILAHRNLTSPVTGDLVALVKSETWLTYRDCDLVKVEPQKTRVKWQTQGGVYRLKVLGDTFRDEYVLRPGDPSLREFETREYDPADVERVLYTGVSRGAEVSSNEAPLATLYRLS